MPEIDTAKSVERISTGMGLIPYMRHLRMEFVEGGEGYIKTRHRRLTRACTNAQHTQYRGHSTAGASLSAELRQPVVCRWHCAERHKSRRNSTTTAIA